MPIRLGKKTSRGGSSRVSPTGKVENLFENKQLSTLDASGKELGEHVDDIRSYLLNNHVLTSLNISNNKLAYAEAGKALACGLTRNTTLTELNVSCNSWGSWEKYPKANSLNGYRFAKELAFGIRNATALSKLIFGGDYNGWDDTKNESIKYDPAILEKGIEQADLSNKGLKAGEAVIVGAWISDKVNKTLKNLNISNNKIGELVLPKGWSFNHATTIPTYVSPSDEIKEDDPSESLGVHEFAEAIKANDTLTSLNIRQNGIPVKEAKMLVGIMRSKDKLTTLCDLTEEETREETKLDFSNKGYDDGDVVLIANEIRDNRALVELRMGQNGFTNVDAGEALGDAITCTHNLNVLDIAGGVHSKTKCDWAFINGFCTGLGVTNALTSLNISNNRLGEGVLPKGWQRARQYDWGGDVGYKSPNGIWQSRLPALDLKGVNAIATAISNKGCLNNLKILDISYNGIHESGAITLAHAIKTNEALEKLLMGGNRMATEEAGQAIGEALAKNSMLKELDLSSNTAPRRAKNSMLKELDLSSNTAPRRMDGDGVDDGHKFASELSDGIKNNETLTSLDISANNIPANNAIFNTCNTKGIKCTSQ